MNNNEILSEKLMTLATGNGFIVFAIDDVYVQFSVEDEDLQMYFEAASHNFVDSLTEEIKSDLLQLGFAIEDGNYYKKIDRANVREMVKEVEKLFKDIYKVDYDQPLEITENIGG